jgi:[histone H3]-trimethyl-L-lysine4 demethylase
MQDPFRGGSSNPQEIFGDLVEVGGGQVEEALAAAEGGQYMD